MDGKAATKGNAPRRTGRTPPRRKNQEVRVLTLKQLNALEAHNTGPQQEMIRRLIRTVREALQRERGLKAAVEIVDDKIAGEVLCSLPFRGRLDIYREGHVVAAIECVDYGMGGIVRQWFGPAVYELLQTKVPLKGRTLKAVLAWCCKVEAYERLQRAKQEGWLQQLIDDPGLCQGKPDWEKQAGATP